MLCIRSPVYLLPSVKQGFFFYRPYGAETVLFSNAVKHFFDEITHEKYTTWSCYVNSVYNKI